MYKLNATELQPMIEPYFTMRMHIAHVAVPGWEKSLWFFGQRLWVIVHNTKVVLKTHDIEQAVACFNGIELPKNDLESSMIHGEKPENNE